MWPAGRPLGGWKEANGEWKVCTLSVVAHAVVLFLLWSVVVNVGLLSFRVLLRLRRCHGRGGRTTHVRIRVWIGFLFKGLEGVGICIYGERWRVGLDWAWGRMGLIISCCLLPGGALHVVMNWNVFMFCLLFGLDRSAEGRVFYCLSSYIRERDLVMCLG